MTSPSPSQPIALYDSGVGGLSVLRAVRSALPHEHLLYFGDQAKVPYGSRSLEELRAIAESVARFLLSQGAKLIVIACNTASAAALKHLRAVFPGVPFVGMEPAVKPAAEQTHTRKVGVLATPSTFHGELYASVVERFAQDVEIFQSTCPGLVSQIEKARLNTPKTRRILEEAVLPMLAAGADTLVLGCTHYPFVIPLIEKIAAGRARVIDPAPAVARQTARVLAERDLLNPSPKEGSLRFISSGEAARFEYALSRLLGLNAPAEAARWQGGELILIPKN
ncbi:MAG: glutamate racemase [Chloroflexi bacterium]|nr:glutamate racemase [Chloroflexota bacterium]